MGEAAAATSKQYEALLQSFNNDTQASTPECRIHLIKVKDALFLRIEGRAQQRSFQDLVTQVRPVLTSRRFASLIVDLSMCEAMASSAIGLIAFVMMEAGRCGAAIHLVRANEAVTRTLRVMGVEKLCACHDSVADIPGF